MRFTVGEAVPPGDYHVRFTGPEATQHAEYGSGVRLSWEIVSGPFATKRVSRVTGPTPTPNNVLGMMLSGMAGRSLQKDEIVNADDFIGREFVVKVELKGNVTRVASVFPAGSV